jgi:transcriptional regulator with XRE-family HTH domain
VEQGQVILLVDPRQSAAASGVFDMKTLDMTGKQLRELRERHDLTQPQMAQLLRMALQPRASGRKQSAQIYNYENGKTPIPQAAVELLRCKLYLLEKELTTKEELIERPLDEILADIYS